jgi:hypothetical protein
MTVPPLPSVRRRADQVDETRLVLFLPLRTCSAVLVGTIWPLSMMETRSQTCSTGSMMWLENSTVEPEPTKRSAIPAVHKYEHNG